MGVCLEMVPPGTESLSSESEQEEGEIIDVDDLEDISSDEEFSLRQRIEELETRNLELEKIATISSTKVNGFDYIDLVDDDSSPSYVEYNHHRSSRVFKSERSCSSRRRKERSSRVDEPHRYSLGNIKHEHRKRDKSFKKTCTRHETRPAKVCRRRASIAEHTRHRSPMVHQSSSSDEESTYRPTRNELQAAVDTSLKRKLKGVQQKVTECIAAKVEPDTEESELNASLEIMELLDTLTDQNIIDGDSLKMPQKCASKKLDDHKINSIELTNSTSHSLEEQELRLAALKSAILKKHEARKKRRVIEARPYSPTDTDILLDSHDPEIIGLDGRTGPDHMEISPAVSPTLPDKTLLSVDMDIASDDDSPICTYDDIPLQDPPCFDISNQWIPLPPNSTQNGDISNYSMYRQNHPFIPPPPPPPVPSSFAAIDVHPVIDHATEDEEEMALRALLLSTQIKKKRPVVVKAKVEPHKSVECVDMDLGDGDTDSLRNLVLQSIPKKTDSSIDCGTASLKRAVQRLNGKHQLPKCSGNSTTVANTNFEPHTTRNVNSKLSDRNKENSTIEQNVHSIQQVTNVTQTPVVPMQTIPNHQQQTAPPAKRKLTTQNNAVRITRPSTSNKIAPPSSKIQKRNALITNPIPRKIRPFIIRLTAGGSSSSEESDCTDQRSNSNNGNSVDQFFNPSSPASIAMDSPGYAPSSPTQDIEMGDSKITIGSPDPESGVIQTNRVFEQKLEQYLRSVRTKNDTQSVTTTNSTKTPVKIKIKTSRVTPSAVRHLPLSSQIEYRRLIQRMNSLEKIKDTRTQSNSVPTVIPKQPLPTAIRSDSLIKKVLVKSASGKPTTNCVNKTVPNCQVGASNPPLQPQLPKGTNAKTVPNSQVGASNPPLQPQLPKGTNAKTTVKTADSLKMSEDELRAYSSGFLTKVNGIFEMVQKAQQVRLKQFDLERQRDRLRDQLQMVERRLATEKIAISQLYPSITQGHRMMRAFRQRSVQLRDRCKELGIEVVGAEYRTPTEETKIIEKQIRIVIEETQKLKAMKKAGVAISNEANKPPCAIKRSIENEKEPVITVGSSNPDSIKPSAEAVAPVDEKTLEPDREPTKNKIDCEPPPIDPDVATECNQTNPQESSSDIVNKPTQLPEPQEVEPDAPTSISKYHSPLDAIHSMQKRDVINPDAVLCPYELQGCCDDRECVFQHLGDRTLQ